MNKLWNLRATFWLRIIFLFCGILVNAGVLNIYRNVGSDFVQDYIAAHSLLRGGSLYGEDLTKLANEMLSFSGIPNFHPPFNALMFLPLSFLSYETAFVVLAVLSVVLLLLINQFIVRGLGFGSEWFLNFTCFTLWWYPVTYCLGTGQSSMIIAACLVSGWFCLRFEKAYAAGFFFAIATLIKLFPGLVLLYLLMMKKWRAFFATVSFILLGLCVTAFIVGFDNMRTYTIIMIARDIDEFRGFVLNHSVCGIVTKLIGKRTVWTEPLAELPRISSLLIILLNAAVLIYTILKISKTAAKEELADYAFALTLVAMLLLSPLTWGHIFPVLILPIGLLLREYIEEPSSRRLRLLLFILICLSLPDVLIARALLAMHHPFIMPWYSMLFTLGPSAGLVLLWLIFCRRASISNI